MKCNGWRVIQIKRLRIWILRDCVMTGVIGLRPKVMKFYFGLTQPFAGFVPHPIKLNNAVQKYRYSPALGFCIKLLELSGKNTLFLQLYPAMLILSKYTLQKVLHCFEISKKSVLSSDIVNVPWSTKGQYRSLEWHAVTRRSPFDAICDQRIAERTHNSSSYKWIEILCPGM